VKAGGPDGVGGRVQRSLGVAAGRETDIESIGDLRGGETRRTRGIG